MSFPQATRARAICILGMHRSGTSTVSRAVNLLGAYLGKEEDLGRANEDNPEGYWERTDITRLQNRLLAQLGSRWDATVPLSAEWPQAPGTEPYRKELTELVRANFGSCPLWAWKDPRTCLLLRLWREVLEQLEVELSVIFVVRNPVDVANSLGRRDGMPVRQALELWFHYNLAALEAAPGLPLAFLSYDRLLEAWEPELRKCAEAIRLPWPADETGLREKMAAFIRPKLRHSLTTSAQLQGAPQPVRELYGILSEAVAGGAARGESFWATVRRLARDFRTLPDFFEAGWDSTRIPQAPRPPYLQRTWWRWKRSVRKRMVAWKARGA